MQLFEMDYRQHILDYIRLVMKVSGIYFVWIFMHYMASHLYIQWCVPATILGFVISPFIIPAPHCVGLRWVITNGSNTIIAMWFILGAWLANMIKPVTADSL
jgi:hypothetical protein